MPSPPISLSKRLLWAEPAQGFTAWNPPEGETADGFLAPFMKRPESRSYG